MKPGWGGLSMTVILQKISEEIVEEERERERSCLK